MQHSILCKGPDCRRHHLKSLAMVNMVDSCLLCHAALTAFNFVIVGCLWRNQRRRGFNDYIAVATEDDELAK